MVLVLTFPQPEDKAPTLPRPGAEAGLFTSPTFTASGRAWRIVAMLPEGGGDGGWKAQVRINPTSSTARGVAWEDWRATLGFVLPRAVRKYGDDYKARCILRRRNMGVA
jgi:hypothetical protein